ncbi:DUF4230 domain-containing protein [Cyclobacterium jeungdonense]|uniref:DUF4230 domain-containing protein n=1 Tax=Cyclobacterium jeungdonense TaxID=708087 RepID=A0ABT8CE46_9BACT|nr:DUF4230 domain-containing protein [Cyclobacterium jeungdonense]MDN3690696.1 DUF4230 domain-containing protein [Cyclobacterium jeungdonense]
MYRFLAGIVTALLLYGAIQFLIRQNNEQQEIQQNTALLEQQIQQVGKLLVTEGHFSQVLSYKNTRKNYFDIFSADKKALVIINAKVTVAYDLRQLISEIDPEAKQVRIISIPEPEINIYPDLQYYDVSQDYFNKFDAADYNKIKGSVYKILDEKIQQSDLKADARERLLTELSKIYLLTGTMGWSLHFEETTINSPEELKGLEF